jgi:parallel beta-helix repeat protein
MRHRINTSSFLILAVVAVAACFQIAGQSGTAQQTLTRLPGSRAEIDAANFPSLQAAFDAIPEGGGVVRLPAGTFEITEPLIVSRGDVLLTGAGTATHIVNRNEEGKPALILQHPDGNDVKKDDRLWRVMLSNLRITGNEKSGHGILAVQIQEFFLQGVTVSENGGDGIQLDHCYEDPRVSDCLITYNKAVGLNLLGCHDIVVSSNQFEENQDALHCFDGFNLCMTGNCVDDHLGEGVVIENTYGSVLSGNMIEECNGTAVVLDRDCYGITISANVIAHNGAGIDLRDAHGCSVSANTLTILKTNALRVGPNSGRITITGNNICNSYIGETTVKRRVDDQAAAGITLDGASELAIVGNSFASVRPKAVELTDNPSKRVVFSSNVLTDVSSDHGRLKDSVVTDLLISVPTEEKDSDPDPR